MRNIVFIFSFCLLLACNKKDDDITVQSLQTVTINGYQLRDELGDIAGNVGYPDIKIGNITNFYSPENDYFFVTFPNPSSGIALMSVKSNPQAKTKIWMVHASLNPDADESDPALGASQFVSGGTPVFEDDSIPVYSHANSLFQLDFSMLPNGYYRMYLKSGNILLWDNIVISK